METLQISKANAAKAYESADEAGKKLLAILFGGQLNGTTAKKKTGPVTERVKTFEDALNELGISAQDFAASAAGLTDDELAYRKLKLIARALNEGWKPNWDDSNEYKYWPYFDMRSSAAGFGFSHSDYGRWRSRTFVGSRLCFKSRELSDYAGTQFLDVYREMMVEPA